MKKVSLLVFLAFLVSLLATLTTSAAPQTVTYQVVPMGNFWARAINNRGEVAGRTPDSHAAIWYRGQITMLNLNADWSEAFDINDAGTVLVSAGWSYPARSGFYLVYSNGLIQKVDMPTGSIVHALNNDNTVVGEMPEGRINRGFIWRNSQVTLVTNQNCAMVDINNPGIATGFIWGYGPGEQPFLWLDSHLTPLETPLSVDMCRPEAINNANQVAGWYMLDWADWHPVVWNSTGQMNLISNLRGKTMDINNRGEILGWVEPPGLLYQVTLWRQDGSAIYLEEHLGQPLRILSSTLKINDNGQIICEGMTPDYKFDYYLLRPRPTTKQVNYGYTQEKIE